jgi:FkbM family methyltransferase
VLINFSTLWDLGARPTRVLHVGAHTAEEADGYRSIGADVIWIEAQKHLADQLRARGFHVKHAAVWSEPTLLTFHTTSNGQSSSLLPLGLHRERYPQITVTETDLIKTTTIDAFKLYPDFLNLDIQGAELPALKGATKTLDTVKWIYTEISTEELYEGQALEPELTDWLAARGFKKSLQVLTEYGWGDALYVRSTDGDQ